MAKKGALTKSPSNKEKGQNKPSGDPYKEYKSLQGKSDPQSQQRRRALMSQIQAAKRQGKQQQQSPYEMPQQEIGQGMQNYLQQMQQQGAFNPGSFQDQMSKTYGNVMQQFEQTMAPQFQKQNADFEQMAAERGLDPAGEAYKSMRAELGQQQDMARQAAMSQAQTQAENLQSKYFDQQSTQYQMPGQMLSYYSPFFQQMGEDTRQQGLLGFEANQAELERRNKLALANIAARSSGGGGGLSLQDRMALLDRETANQLALNMSQGGGGQPSRGAGSGFMQGIGQGFGAAIPGAVNTLLGAKK